MQRPLGFQTPALFQHNRRVCLKTKAVASYQRPGSYQQRKRYTCINVLKHRNDCTELRLSLQFSTYWSSYVQITHVMYTLPWTQKTQMLFTKRTHTHTHTEPILHWPSPLKMHSNAATAAADTNNCLPWAMISPTIVFAINKTLLQCDAQNSKLHWSLRCVASDFREWVNGMCYLWMLILSGVGQCHRGLTYPLLAFPHCSLYHWHPCVMRKHKHCQAPDRKRNHTNRPQSRP